MAAACADEPETTGTPGCAGADYDFSMKLNGTPWNPACSTATGAGFGAIEELQGVAFDSPESSDDTKRSVLIFVFPYIPPGTYTIGEPMVSVSLKGPLISSVGQEVLATSGTIAVLTGTPEWSGVIDVVLANGDVITEGKFAFRYPR